MMSRILYEQSGFPVLQNRVYDSPAAARACAVGDIRLIEDADTGLVLNEAFDPGLVVYDEHYQNEQAMSPQFRQHLADVADLVVDRCGTQNLIEIGCGKGFFLEMLVDRGCDVIGYDPAYEGDNPRIIKEFARCDALRGAKGIILRHVLEHIQDPLSFLTSFKEVGREDCVIYIEVPCFDWICRNRSWVDIFYEHANYFRARDFREMFGGQSSVRRLFGGQYLGAVGNLKSLRRPVARPEERVEWPDGGLIPSDRLEHLMDGAVIWGASSKGVIFSLLMDRFGNSVARVIDINPVKQGRFLAVTGLQVEAPEQVLPEVADGGTIYVMNSNYLDEIRLMAGGGVRLIALDQLLAEPAVC